MDYTHQLLCEKEGWTMHTCGMHINKQKFNKRRPKHFVGQFSEIMSTKGPREKAYAVVNLGCRI